MIIRDKLISSLDAIPAFVLAQLEKLRFSVSLKEKEAFDIKLCLEEALTNAIKHGNKLNPDLTVSIYIKLNPHSLLIKVKDQGEGFDFKNLPDPTKKWHFKKPYGRGVFLIKRLMDEVSFFDGGSGIKMLKFIKKEALR